MKRHISASVASGQNHRDEEEEPVERGAMPQAGEREGQDQGERELECPAQKEHAPLLPSAARDDRVIERLAEVVKPDEGRGG